jgi:hypothetical protein
VGEAETSPDPATCRNPRNFDVTASIRESPLRSGRTTKAREEHNHSAVDPIDGFHLIQGKSRILAKTRKRVARSFAFFTEVPFS